MTVGDGRANMLRTLGWAVAALALVGCGGSGSAPEAAAPVALGEPTLTNINSKIFLQSCAISGACHSGPNPTGLTPLDGSSHDAYKNLVGMAALEDPMTTLVVPKDPEKSLLYRKLTGSFEGLACNTSQSCGVMMPKTGGPLDAAKIQLIKDWISNGAKDD